MNRDDTLQSQRASNAAGNVENAINIHKDDCVDFHLSKKEAVSRLIWLKIRTKLSTVTSTHCWNGYCRSTPRLIDQGALVMGDVGTGAINFQPLGDSELRQIQTARRVQHMLFPKELTKPTVQALSKGGFQ